MTKTATRTVALGIDSLRKHFGGVRAVHDVSFDVGVAEIVGVVGPNGAGKSTLLAAVSGHLPHDAGRVVLHDTDLTSLPAHRRARLGIRRTFQVSRLLPGLSILDNVKVGGMVEEPVGVLRSLFTTRRSTAANRRLEERAFDALSIVGLEKKAHLQPQQLAYGELRLVELARALIGRPSVLLLDEPAAGLNTAEARRLGETLERMIAEKAAGSIVLVEHNLPLVVRVSTRMCVLNFGELIAAGPPDEVVDDPKVREAYTGA